MTARTRTPDGSETEAAEPGPSYERVDLERYVVLHDGPIGYVEAVAPVFVCYVGHPYPRAVEVAQVHDFHHAVRIVEIAATSAAPKIAE